MIAKTKKWGNSIGILIPKKEADSLNIREDQEVIVEIIKKENPLKKLFGALRFRKSTEELLEESKKELSSIRF